MKITNEQLKQIIKEELESVMNESESLIYGMGLAAAARRRRQSAKTEPDYIPPRSSSQRQRDADFRTNMARIQKDLEARDADRAAEEEARQQYVRDIDPSLEALGQAKLKAIQALGRDEDGNLPYMYAFGGMQGDPEMLETYYDGPLGFQDAIRLAKNAGELSENAIDDESGGFYLGSLFPGEYEQE